MNKYAQIIKKNINKFKLFFYNNISFKLSTLKSSIIKVLIPCVIIIICIFYSLNANNNISKNIVSIFAISDDIRHYYSDKQDYWKLSTKYVIDNAIINNNLVDIKDDKINLKNGQSILIGYGINAEVIPLGSDTFEITMPNLNKSKCIAYLESEISSENLIKVTKISINNADTYLSYSWGGDNNLPIKKYSSRKICSKNNNTITWTLK